MLREPGVWEVVTNVQFVALSTVFTGEFQRKLFCLGVVTGLESLCGALWWGVTFKRLR